MSLLRPWRTPTPNKYLKKIPTRDTVTLISRVLKRVKLAGVSQYPAWGLYL